MPNPTHSTRRPTRAAAVLLSALLALFIVADCSQPTPPTPISHQLYIIFDVSSSTSGAADGYGSRATALITDQTNRSDNLEELRSAADQSATDQVACGDKASTPGSDLIGFLLAADSKLQPACRPKSSSTPTGCSTPRTSACGDEVFVVEPGDGFGQCGVVGQGAPVQMTGAQICISDPAVGTPMTAEEAHGVDKFWTACAHKAHATFCTL